MSESPTGWRGLVRNPFFWAALAGLILVPAIRPLTRHVPPPPPVSGQVLPFEATDQHGRPAGSVAFRDHVYLAQAPGAVAATAPARIAALVKLQRRCARMGVRLRLLTFARDSDPEGADGLRRAIEVAGGDLSRSGGDCGGGSGSGCGTWMVAAAAAPPPFAQLPADRGLLVDGDGGARGTYPTDDDGLDEVFHRAQHVMSLRRAWR